MHLSVNEDRTLYPINRPPTNSKNLADSQTAIQTKVESGQQVSIFAVEQFFHLVYLVIGLLNLVGHVFSVKMKQKAAVKEAKAKEAEKVKAEEAEKAKAAEAEKAKAIQEQV